MDDATSRLVLLPAQGSDHLMAIDMPIVVRRAWHGHVNAERHEPEKVAPTSLKQFARLLRARQAPSVVFADEGRDLYRLKLYDGYKAGRPPKPTELFTAEVDIRNALAIAGITPWAVRGLEADDVLQAAALRGRALRIPVVLVTHDKDADQLVDDDARVFVWDGDESVTDEAAVLAKWGMPPNRLVELFALAGDSGDGIPGVDGWGPKRAAELLKYAGTERLDSLLRDGGHWWVPKKWRAKFIENREVIKLSASLAKLRGAWLSTQPSFDVTMIDPLETAERLLDLAKGME